MKTNNYLHFLDAVFVDSFQILCSIDKNRGDEVAKSFKYVPVTLRTPFLIPT